MPCCWSEAEMYLNLENLGQDLDPNIPTVWGSLELNFGLGSPLSRISCVMYTVPLYGIVSLALLLYYKKTRTSNLPISQSCFKPYGSMNQPFSYTITKSN